MPELTHVTVESVSAEIIRLLEADSDAANLSADTVLTDVGVDSLKVMTIVFKIEALYNITLNEEDADDLTTIRDLAALVVRSTEVNA